MMKIIYKLNPIDNVGTALSDLEKNNYYPIFEEGKGVVGSLCVLNDIPKWYKVALSKILEDEFVLKFGYPMGIAVIDIEPGMIVHITNIILNSNFNFNELIEYGFILGRALVNIDKGSSIRIGQNFAPSHPKLRGLPHNTKIGVAASRIVAGEIIRLGNIVDLKHKLGWNIKYRSLVKDFYKFIYMGIMSMSRG